MDTQSEEESKENTKGPKVWCVRRGTRKERVLSVETIT